MKGSIQLPYGEMLLALEWGGAGCGDTHTQTPGACCARVENDKTPPEYRSLYPAKSAGELQNPSCLTSLSTLQGVGKEGTAFSCKPWRDSKWE